MKKSRKGICFNTGRTHFKKGEPGYWLGKHRSEKTKRKISEGHIDKPLTKEHKKKIKEGTKRHYRFNPRRTGENNPAWKGGRTTGGGGYIYIYRPNHPFAHQSGYIAEHRLVVEKKLKRYLKSNEFVHHLNGIRTDNRIENLAVCHPKTHYNFIRKLQERIKFLENKLAI